MTTPPRAFYAPCLHIDEDDNKLTVPIEGGALPDAFVFDKVCGLIAELTANADEFTQIRCGQFSFATGVMEFLRRDQRLVLPRMRPLDHGYDLTRMNRVVEGRMVSARSSVRDTQGGSRVPELGGGRPVMDVPTANERHLPFAFGIEEAAN